MKLTIAPAAWSLELAQLLEAAMRRDPWCTIESLEREVAAGRATLLAITREEGELFGAAVLEIHRHDRGADGVIVAAAFARRTGWRYVPWILEDLERRFRGLTRIRVQTPSRGLVRMLARRGYRAHQVVLLKNLTPAPAMLRASAARDAELELERRDAPAPRARRRAAALRAVPGLCYIKGHQTDKSTTKQEDRRLALAEGSIGISGDENVLNILDAGAIEKAFDFATASDQETHKTLAGVLDFAGTVFEKGTAQIETQSALVAQAYDQARGDSTQKNLVAAAALATVAVVAVKTWGKR